MGMPYSGTNPDAKSTSIQNLQPDVKFHDSMSHTMTFRCFEYATLNKKQLSLMCLEKSFKNLLTLLLLEHNKIGFATDAFLLM